MLRFSMQIYKNKMRVAKMLTEKIIFIFIFFGQAFIEEWYRRSKWPLFLLSPNCYLLSVICTAKIRFWKLSTVNCNAWGWFHWPVMWHYKNKAQKIWNISLLFVYLQRTMVQIQKLIFHILKDFKEAVCEYRLFSIFYARSASWISAPT